MPPAELPAAVAALRTPDLLGANVTVPHKGAIVPLLDRLTPEAERVGAVNTVTPRGGALEGHNTDVEGVLRALDELPLERVAAVEGELLRALDERVRALEPAILRGESLAEADRELLLEELQGRVSELGSVVLEA